MLVSRRVLGNNARRIVHGSASSLRNLATVSDSALDRKVRFPLQRGAGSSVSNLNLSVLQEHMLLI